jgi:hypothetical protein
MLSLPCYIDTSSLLLIPYNPHKSDSSQHAQLTHDFYQLRTAATHHSTLRALRLTPYAVWRRVCGGGGLIEAFGVCIGNE